MAEPTLFDEASLALIASGGAGKDGKVYSVKPTDGTGDFTFSRGSNLAATRVGADGLIEKGRENLLLRSNSFNSAPWSTSSSDATTGQSGYDGTNDAWLLSKTAINGRVQQNLVVTGVQTFSVYAKAGTNTWMNLLINGSVSPSVFFDLQNGVLGSVTSSTIKAKIVSVGNGWYRCSATFNATTSRYRIYVSDGDNDNTGTSGNIFIQDAQVELGLISTSVIETGALTAQAGILEDTPRFDYSGGATCPSLLLEPSRTNLHPRSEYIDGWLARSSVSDVVTTQNYTTSPEGVQNATRIEFNANGWMHGGLAQTNGTQYTISCYAKRNDSGSQTFALFINGSGSLDVPLALTNEWKRFDYTYTASNSSTMGFAGANGADVSVYGFQVEQASYVSSYIPNHSGGTITRGGDVCGGAGDASTFNSTEGVLYTEIAALADTITDRHMISISDGTTTNRVYIRFGNASNIIEGRSTVGGLNVGLTSYTVTDETEFHKVAYKWKLNEYSLWIDGTEVSTQTGNVASANTFNTLDFTNGAGGQVAEGKTKQVLVFKEALSDTELIKLTTI